MRAQLAVNILACCQYNSRINLQRNGFGAADNQDHANNLNAPAPLLQLRLIGFSTIGNRHHIAIFIEKADLTNPPPADIFRYNLFCNDLAHVRRVHRQHIQRGAATLMYESSLCRIRCRQYTIAITNGQLGNLNFRTQRRGFCQFCRPDIGQQGKIFSRHLRSPRYQLNGLLRR